MSKLLAMPQPGIPDASERAKALDISRSWIVEAPAGSGKTGLLIQRYLRLLTDPNVCEPEQVLAITFTKAATEEIRDRVLSELTRASVDAEATTEYDRATRTMAKAVLLRDSERRWGLLDDPGRLRVRTIDAICAEIARSLPVLCGGNGSLTPIEDPSVLYDEAARRTWMCLGGEDTALSGALRSLLLHRDGDLSACIALVAEMLALREQWGSLVPVREEDLQDEALDSFVHIQLDSALEQVVCETLSRIVHAFPEQTLSRLTTLANSLSERAGYRGQPSPIAICRDLRTSPAAAADHLIHWRALAHLLIAPSTASWRKSFSRNHLRIEITAQDRSLLEEITLDVQQHPDLLDLLNDTAALPSPHFPSELWPLTKSLFRVLRRALAELQTVFLETSHCDFTEPASLARRVLMQKDGLDDLQTALGTDLKHLLVDEMQDTSGQQHDLLERLTFGWEETQKTVFLVGDPKQSIYLFRQARVERFYGMMRSGMLGRLPVQSLQLTANFRSQAALVEAFNRDFSKIFPQTINRAEDVIYVEAAATRSISSGPSGARGAVWHLSVASGSPLEVQQRSREKTHQSARQIRTVVEAWQARPLPARRTAPWKIAVLVQSRASLGPVLSELQRSPAIPVNALKMDTLNERPEIQDLFALTRALLHPADRTAWLAVLHAPWCGLGLADLHTLTGTDDPASLGHTILDLISTHGTEISMDGAQRLDRVRATLSAAMHSSGRLRLPERVERTWRSLKGASYLDANALQNAGTFFELLQTMDREDGKVIDTDLLRKLKRLYASADTQDGAVDLVTIHGAKGLEWDVVLVPELERRSAVNRSRLFEWEEVSSAAVVLAPISGKGEEAVELTGWIRRIRAKREAAERKRLFYVGCTRAREELHLFGVASTQGNGTIQSHPSSLLHASWKAAEVRLAEMEDLSLSFGSSSGVVSSLAAASDEVVDGHQPMLERLPLEAMPLFQPGAYILAPSIRTEEASRWSTLQPQGSFTARCLGTAVHLFLEEAANRLAEGVAVSQLASEVRSWESRIRAVLRRNGLPSGALTRGVPIVSRALNTTLQDPTGRWMLEARLAAHSELALASKTQEIRKYRIDRIFRAGATPGDSGHQYLWIIDYKTTAFIGDGQDPVALKSFLENERLRFQPQLEAYARPLNDKHVRLGLWFPLIGHLTWWSQNQHSESPHEERS